MARVLAASDVVVVASGTATLEAALMQTPMVVVYRVSPVTFRLGKRMVQVQSHQPGQPDRRGDGSCPELIQDDATPERIARRGRYRSWSLAREGK